MHVAISTSLVQVDRKKTQQKQECVVEEYEFQGVDSSIEKRTKSSQMEENKKMEKN